MLASVAPHTRAAFSATASITGCRSVGELEMTRRISAVAVCCSSASVSSRVRSSTLRSRPAYDSLSWAAMLLNWSPSASSSSPVRTSIRWSSSPAPIRAAPARSAWMGVTMRRARTRLAATERMTPATRSMIVRWIEALRLANASSSGCSANTVHLSGAMVA